MQRRNDLRLYFYIASFKKDDKQIEKDKDQIESKLQKRKKCLSKLGFILYYTSIFTRIYSLQFSTLPTLYQQSKE